ncbi:MAG TPA: hypothetical protein VFG59_06065 [Anaeromyxobacter sp.]|nr:hypothetical protein [Anaeromyxobacter sp.]
MRARGYTLVELMIASLVSLLTIAAGVSLLVASQGWFQSGSDDRQMQETARVAMDEMMTNLRSAGYGMEPTFAFDFGILANTAMDRIPAGDQARFGGYCGDSDPPCARDSTAGSDEIVFYSRDLSFERDVVSVGADGNSLVVARPASGGATTLLPGQVLQLMCYGSNNQWIWAYVTVASVDSSGANPAVALSAGAGGQPFDFPYQNSLLTQACFNAGAASVKAFKIDRYHYFVEFVDDSGKVQPFETAGARPYLMLDQGLRQDGKLIVAAVAPDVEDLQLAYVFPLASGAQVLGAPQNPGDPLTLLKASDQQDDTGINLIPAPPFVIPSFSAAPNDLDLARTTHQPANIRAVKVALTVRSPRLDLAVQDDKVPAAFNRDQVDGEKGYRRMVFESTAYTRNMETTLPVFPTYDPNYNKAGVACCPVGGVCAGNCGGG